MLLTADDLISESQHFLLQHLDLELQFGLMLCDSLSELVVLLAFDFLSPDDLLETIELLVEFLDHDFVLFEGGFGLFVFG